MAEDQKTNKFEPPSKNKDFIENYREYLKQKVTKITMLMQNPNDMTSQSEYFNLLMMFSLNRKLFESKDQERDTFKKIWGLQKLCPIIIIYNNLKCIPGKFLNTVCPLKKPSKSLDPKDLGAHLKNEITVRSQSFQAQTQLHYIKVIDWIVKLNSDVLKQGPKGVGDESQYLERLSDIIVAGISLAVEIKRSTKTLMILHDTMGVTLS